LSFARECNLQRFDITVNSYHVFPNGTLGVLCIRGAIENHAEGPPFAIGCFAKAGAACLDS
jgi:hypothetical protein